ncbi:TIGR00730 family Rossman fold protein [Alishewanella sp. 16-MA]|uniref:Cytokinin riboside 5'-monophosphate phosphoribohydrolase n=1 Tax=Alishewanella maricola TaxID=2795740 RepID=A0ABS8C7N9_9ALTE|nr:MULTISPECIES: TIGR00730 family Rossman fold protein [Alishewanella]MCB5227960.1 TIGR00730 family Rossman fold protein [Alishewanella maricola]MDP5037317.1 TIGR00730 family Rossman fold protein [Alishewanella sp.]MDP5187504.1 TIGR00730 family Rossman fold protein [Alishewanella sp.]MDP5460841.1 TIGR00730 family Rossman fold protein [Alishewanella sp. SMS8]
MSENSTLYKRHFASAQESLDAITQLQDHNSFKLAFADNGFLMQDELRHVRLQLEYLKPQMVLEQHGINATIVVFGSARFLSPSVAASQLAEVQQRYAGQEHTAEAVSALQQAQRDVRNSQYYAASQAFARIVTTHNGKHPATGLMIISGGGPGVMEAANRGAMDANGKSIGLNIVLPKEQHPNPYITPELCFQFHYFAIRKMHFLQRAQALVAFPGGFGTLDELFETLTLIQTRKAKRVPVILYDKAFWQRLINFDMLAEEGLISPEDLELIQFVDTPEQAWEIIYHFYGLANTET